MGSIEAPGGETEVKAATSAGEALSLGRPRYHVVAPSGWMNDPCAPGYMPSSGEFNLMYQWNPYSHLWDNISWGQMRSKGLVKWEQVLQEPVFVPDQPYDQKGIFTGCLHPTSPAGDPNGLSIFYTSVPHIPIHWTTPHVRGQEGVALATSNDGGKTWQKDDNNPIVRAEPEHLDVTGFRDPSVIPWHTLDRLLGRRAGEGLYALISGGIQNLNTSDAGVDIASTTSSRCIEGQANEGPRLFLYDIDPNNLKSWRYLSTLGKTFPRNLIPHQWTGDFGANWECATVFSLRHAASGIERDVCILGVEGGGLRPHVQEYRKANPGSHERAARYAHWFFPSLSVEPGSAVADMEKVDMAYTTGGLVDWAELYAFATFPHPDGRRIGLGWLVELDLPDAMAEQKEWTGCLGLPREFELQVHGAVKGTLAGTPVEDIGSFEVVKGGNEEGTRVVTMGVRPLRELESLRGRAIRIPTCAPGEEEGVEMPECYELHLVTSITDTDSPMTITLRASPPASATDIRTTISFDPAKETIVINRAKSTTLAGLCLQDEVAPFTLLRFEDGSVEELDLRVFVDRDLIEVFVNGRVSLSTRVYAPKEVNGLKVDVQGGAVVKLCEAWQMGDIGLPE